MSDTDLVTSHNTEEILKEFLELVNALPCQVNKSDQHENSLSTKHIDEKYVLDNIKIVLDNCVKRNGGSKCEMSVKILEILVKNYSNLNCAIKISEHIASILEKSYFEKISKLFESDNPENAMKLIRLLIGILGKVLHHNLSITNPLLQIVESGFKHTKNEIKSSSYECWACLINNFSLEKSFFFKSKTFRLMLMPLQNKCKTYKEEDVCKAKIFAWLCLIENINEKLPSHFLAVVIPFLNYCFGVSEAITETKTSQKAESIFDDTKSLVSDHHYPILTQIGFELFVSILFNGDLNWVNQDKELRKKFKYVNLNKEYNIKHTLKESSAWLHLLKCYFSLFITKPNLFDGTLLLEIWKRFCDLFKLNYRCKETDANIIKNESTTDDLDEDDKIFMIGNYFLLSSIEYINASLVNSKTNENKFQYQLIKYMLQVFKAEYNKILFKNEKFKSELLKMIKKAATFLLSSDEESTSNFLENLTKLFQLIESHTNLIDLDNWLYIANKFYDHLRSIKTKSNIINLTVENFDIVHSCIIFPIKHYKKLNCHENDIKLIVSSSTNICKLFSSLIKQNRLKIDDKNYINNISINNWCSKIFYNINQVYNETTTTSDSFVNNSHNLVDETIKNLQLRTQFSLFLMQNVFEFDTINNPIHNSDSMDEDIAPASQSTVNRVVIENLNFSSGKKVDSFLKPFLNLIEFIQRETKRFYDLVLSHHQHGIESSTDKNEELIKKRDLNEDSSDSNDTKKESENFKVNESKQPIHIFCHLIEILSILFTRVKTHQILNEFLISFATSVEQTSELHSISKQSISNFSSNTDSPASSSKHKHNHSRFSLGTSNNSNTPNLVTFQSNRRSNDLYDTFSMQIASYIQNHLTQTYFTHEFDSILLKKLEPIFYSFLKYSAKLSLKQKTLQAWNSTFGKSTVSTLSYTKRLENLFVELREEMIRSNSNGSNQSRTNIGLIAISLPGFKPIDLLNQATNTTTTDDYMLNEEKENTPEHLTTNDISVTIGSQAAANAKSASLSSKEFINESSNSVPMAQLVMKSASETNKQQQLVMLNSNDKNILTKKLQKNDNLLQQSQTQNSTDISTNFVFSPVGPNSFLNTFKKISSSASKLSSLKETTPTNHSSIEKQIRSSPRSLKQNSKRKLDLNTLLDQMPDKDFVEINQKNSESASNCNLMNKFEEGNSKGNSSPANKTKFKKPLTEHQKEVRKQKSFIPMEIQQVCNGLEPNMDSQMSCTNDYEDSMQSQSFIITPSNDHITNAKSRQSLPSNITCKSSNQFTQINKSVSNHLEDENANDQMDMDKDDDFLLANMDISQSEKRMSVPVIKETTETKEKEDTTSLSTTSSLNLNNCIKFQSKINPKKQIELVEVNLDKESPPSSYGSVTSSYTSYVPANDAVGTKVPCVEKLVVGEDVKIVEVKTITNSDYNDIDSTNNDEKNESKRRSSARLSLKTRERLNALSSEKTETIFNETKTSTTDQNSKTDSTLTNSTYENSSQHKMEENLNVAKKIVIRRLKSNKELFNLYMKNKRNKNACSINLKANTAGVINKNLRVNFKNKNLKKYPAIRNSFTNATAPTFKEKVNQSRKIMKYKRLIRNLKKDNKNDLRFKNSTRLNKIKDLQSEKNEDEKIQHESAEKLNESKRIMEEDDNDDEDKPLIQLVQKERSKKLKSNELEHQQPIEQPSLVVEELSSINKTNLLETLMEEGNKNSLEQNKVISVNETLVANESPATPNASRVTRSSLLPNSSFASTGLAQKISTPTSILKKKGISKLIGETALANNPLITNNDTPGKRRVSFCDSIQIEEIEPNNNKSLFTRTTPKVQNKAKLVLTPYFNKPNTSTLNTSTANTSSNLTGTPTSNTTNNSQTPAGSLSDISKSNLQTNNDQNKDNSNKQSLVKDIQLASNKLSNNLNLGSSSASKLSSTRYSDAGCLLSPSLSNSNIINGNQSTSLSVPSSPSLLTNFFSNKQSFLSQRSTKIQEQMLQQQQSKSDTNLYATANLTQPIINQQTQKTVTLSAISNDSPQKLFQKATPTKESTDESTANCIYPKLKNSNSSIEALLLNDTFSVYLTKGAFKTFQSKNIFTIGNLCSTNSSDLISLPFRSPKMENFLNFIHKFDEEQSKALDHEQSILSKISECAAPVAYMGSVEEEMEKLESTNCFDTSIECEKDSEESDKVAKITEDSSKKLIQEDNNILEKNTSESDVATHEISVMSVEMDTNDNQSPEEKIKKQISKDLEMLEKDLHEKISELFKLKNLINFADVKKEELLKELKQKHDTLELQLRMRFY